ncbi:Protein-disulfide isomerase [Altererythrobacter xiamenensis]|uniref:Protein-disulfide isomerase n=1 Tax=Altererythrobacter xiamenensis TaxID=1316679 RepID=A0A1Y6F2U2_9SPHN|nr:DsbA family protein [Altererythrobacter xiamenensis]SMQ68909.1 Protein-disulfide isomerase [Altererythrobacter xiamenensis]
MGNGFKTALVSAVVALAFGFLGAGIWSWSGLADTRTKEYLLENPELLQQMADAYQQKQAQERLASVSQDVREAFPGAVIGNPEGSKVLVEFTDYNCPYCRQSMEDVKRLVADDPEVKVVIREWPIFQGSDVASRMALAAAMQGKYEAFHDAMFRLGPVTAESVAAAAREAGLDMDQAREDGMSEQVETELQRNQMLAQQLGFSGTPSWVTADDAFEGAIGYAGLKAALEADES